MEIKATVGIAAVALVGSMLTTAPALSDAPDGRTQRGPDDLRVALEKGRVSRAEYSLARAESLFHLGAVRNRWGDVRRPDPHAATLLLRDLGKRLDELGGAQKRQALRVLARPSDGASDPQGYGWDGESTVGLCSDHLNENDASSLEVCFHWIEDIGDPDAPNPTDLGPNGVPNDIPDFVDRLFNAFYPVWDREINQLGYRMPLEDGGTPQEGGSPGLDIYLADLGRDRLYGYCTNDEPVPNSQTQSAYCVMDNDFAKSQFEPGVYGSKAMKVTLAHEFFHAIQFAYDWDERRFFMEGSAVWMEDEVFDDINANYDFLHDSPLHQPQISLDAGDWRWDENFEYGSWLFWRFLSEYTAPELVREVWEGSEGDGDVFAALSEQLAERGTSLAETYAEFAAWNRSMDSRHEGLAAYEEGVAYLDAVGNYWPPPSAEHWLGPTWGFSTGWRTLVLDHLTMRYVFFDSAGNVSPDARVRLSVDLPNDVVGTPRVILTAGKLTDYVGTTRLCSREFAIPLDDSGGGERVLPLANARCKGKKRPVLWLTLILTNGGFGDDVQFEYRGAIVR